MLASTRSEGYRRPSSMSDKNAAEMPPNCLANSLRESFVLLLSSRTCCPKVFICRRQLSEFTLKVNSFLVLKRPIVLTGETHEKLLDIEV